MVRDSLIERFGLADIEATLRVLKDVNPMRHKKMAPKVGLEPLFEAKNMGFYWHFKDNLHVIHDSLRLLFHPFFLSLLLAPHRGKYEARC